jgi:hypothetical protein
MRVATSRRSDSNRRPTVYKTVALPTELLRRIGIEARLGSSASLSNLTLHVEHPKDIGDRTTLAVILALRDAGYAIYVPFGENTRADLVLDDGFALARVQCKTGRLRRGAVRFATCSSYAHHPNPKISSRDYHGDVDYFAVHCPETRGVYLVPIDDLPTTARASLRVDAPKNNQRRRIRNAADYEIATVDTRLTSVRVPRPEGPAGAPAVRAR